jgi:hypothetical protein
MKLKQMKFELMKLKQMMLGSAVAAAVAFGASTASAVTSYYPWVTLAVSGTVEYAPNPDDNVQGVPLKTVSFTTASLIALFNASESSADDIYSDATVLGVSHTTTQIPAGSYFIWNVDEEAIDITNKNGFLMPGADFSDLYMDIDEDDDLIGTYGTNATGAGTETDLTSCEFGFDDDYNNELYIYGTATLTWTYGAASGGAQKATLSVAITGIGDDDSEVGDYFTAVAQTFSASGTGSITGFPTADVPFFWEY